MSGVGQDITGSLEIGGGMGNSLHCIAQDRKVRLYNIVITSKNPKSSLRASKPA